MTRTRAPAPPSLGLLGSLLQQPSPLFTARPVPSLSLHARPASALARLGPPRPWLGSARLGSARPLASHSLSLHPTRTTWHGPPCLLTTCSLTHVCVATRLCCPCPNWADQVCLPIGSPQHALLATALCCHTHTIVACLHTTPGCDQACRSRQGLARPAQRALSAHASPNVFVCCLHPRTAQWAALGPALSAWPDSARHPGSPAHSRVCVLTHVCVCSNYVFALWIALVPLA
jgi:hypothetical protein